MRNIAAAAVVLAGLALGFLVGRGSVRTADARREVQGSASEPVVAREPLAPPAPATTSGPPAAVRRIAEEAAVEEERRWRAYEAELARLEAALADVRSVAKAEAWERAADMAEQLLAEVPRLDLAILDPAPLEKRARLLRVQLRQLLAEAQLALLRAQQPADDSEAAIHYEKQLRLQNRVREAARQLAELECLPPPSTEVMRRREPRADPPRETDEAPWRTEAKQKLASILVSLEFTGAPASSVVEFLREFSGMNVVVRGALGATPVTIKLKDVPMEAALNHFADAIGARWEVDRFGVIVIAAR